MINITFDIIIHIISDIIIHIMSDKILEKQGKTKSVCTFDKQARAYIFYKFITCTSTSCILNKYNYNIRLSVNITYIFAYKFV